MQIYKRRKGGYIAYGTLEELKSLHDLYDSVRIFYFHNGSHHDYSEELFAIFKSSVRLHVEKEFIPDWDCSKKKQGERAKYIHPDKYDEYEYRSSLRMKEMFKVSRYYEEE